MKIFKNFKIFTVLNTIKIDFSSYLNATSAFYSLLHGLTTK